MDLNDYFRNEENCIQYFIKKRWNGHITCPHKRCQNTCLTIINQLANGIRVKQKSAWFMLQRIREVMKNDNNDKFTGTTEIDEAYLGGSETNKHADKKNKTEKTRIIGLSNNKLVHCLCLYARVI